MQKRSAVDGISDCLANPDILQGGIAQIERQIGKHRSRRALNLQVRLALERHDRVRRKSVDRDIGAALAQFKRPRRRIRHDNEAYASKACPGSPVVIVAFDDDFLVLLGAQKLEWSRAHRLARDLVERPIGHNPTGSLGEIP